MASTATFLVEGFHMRPVIELDCWALGLAELAGKRQLDGRRSNRPGSLRVGAPVAAEERQQPQEN